MQDRYLFRGKRAGNGEWVIWDAITGIPHDLYIQVKTICQCTGLRDKNGKPIFEHDILSRHLDPNFPDDETREVVRWEGYKFVTRQLPIKDHMPEELDEWDGEHFEVIGNEFDN